MFSSPRSRCSVSANESVEHFHRLRVVDQVAEAPIPLQVARQFYSFTVHAARTAAPSRLFRRGAKRAAVHAETAGPAEFLMLKAGGRLWVKIASRLRSPASTKACVIR